MLKFFYIFIVIPLCLSALSCAKGDDTLRVQIVDDETFLIPATTLSCKAKALNQTEHDDVSADYFQFSKIALEWTDKKNVLYLSGMFIEVESPNFVGGKVACAIAGDEMANMGRPYDESNPTSLYNWSKWGRATLAPEQKFFVSCAATCGGIKGVGRFAATGTFTIYGYSVDHEGRKTPVESRTFVTIEKRIGN